MNKVIFHSYVSLLEGKSHEIPLNHHFPMVFLSQTMTDTMPVFPKRCPVKLSHEVVDILTATSGWSEVAAQVEVGITIPHGPHGIHGNPLIMCLHSISFWNGWIYHIYIYIHIVIRISWCIRMILRGHLNVYVLDIHYCYYSIRVYIIINMYT